LHQGHLPIEAAAGNEGPIIAVVSDQPHSEESAGTLRIARLAKEGNMVIAPTLAKAVLFRPTTKREADLVAFKLFCLFSFILVGLITAGIL
jgi:hypothetical protein